MGRDNRSCLIPRIAEACSPPMHKARAARWTANFIVGDKILRSVNLKKPNMLNKMINSQKHYNPVDSKLIFVAQVSHTHGRAKLESWSI